MPTVDIPFGEWLPSAPTFKNPGCVVADNVIPAANGSYRPLLSLVFSGDRATGGSNLITNGTFDTDLSGWTSTGDWTQSGGVASISTTSIRQLQQTFGGRDAAKTYSFDVTVSLGAVDLFVVFALDSQSANSAIIIEDITSDGTYTGSIPSGYDGISFSAREATGGANVLTATVDNVSVASEDVVRGSRQFFDDSNNSVIVGGTDTSLFVRRNSLTETTGYTSIGAGEFWDFARFNRFIIATSGTNDPQYLDEVNTDTGWSALGGSPPQAKRCAKVGEFIMLGDVSGTGNRIQWSAFNNPDGTWGTDRQNQSGLADLDAQFGAVQRIVGGRYATVFQERGIQRLSYIGPPVVWRADVIEADRGCVAPFSVATVGYISFFLAQDGFYMTNGSTVQPIGTNRINRWFFDNANQGKLTQVQAAIDWQNEMVVWSFASSGSEDANRLIMYSWAQQRWSSGTVTVDGLVGAQVDGTSIDDLDATYNDLDSIPISLDSPAFKAGDRQLGAFVNGEYATFSGTSLQATWETGEAQPRPAQRVFVSEVYPIIDAVDWDMSVQVLMRNNRGVASVSPARTTGWGGFAAVRGEGQKVAIRAIKPAGGIWSETMGVQVKYTPGGSR